MRGLRATPHGELPEHLHLRGVHQPAVEGRGAAQEGGGHPADALPSNASAPAQGARGVRGAQAALPHGEGEGGGAGEAEGWQQGARLPALRPGCLHIQGEAMMCVVCELLSEKLHAETWQLIDCLLTLLPPDER